MDTCRYVSASLTQGTAAAGGAAAAGGTPAGGSAVAGGTEGTAGAGSKRFAFLVDLLPRMLRTCVTSRSCFLQQRLKVLSLINM